MGAYLLKKGTPVIVGKLNGVGVVPCLTKKDQVFGKEESRNGASKDMIRFEPNGQLQGWWVECMAKDVMYG